MSNKGAFKIIYYFVLWGILSFVSLKVKDIIIGRINSSDYFFNPVFSFYEVHNTGAAFNLFQGNTGTLILAAVICIIVLTALVLAKSSKLEQAMVTSMALLSCGMTLNTIERIQNGYVTDYISFTFFKSFPVFNVPDMMIVFGAVCLALSLISRSLNEK